MRMRHPTQLTSLYDRKDNAVSSVTSGLNPVRDIFLKDRLCVSDHECAHNIIIYGNRYILETFDGAWKHENIIYTQGFKTALSMKIADH